MNSLRRLFLAASTGLLLLATSAIAADANIAGEWTLTVESQMGTSNPTFSLQQEGAKLSGTYKGALGEAPVTGTVTGNDFAINFQVNAQGMDLAVTYSGTVDGSSMKGTVKLGDLGDASFTGKKSG